MAKGLKLKVRKFWGLILTFVEVTGEKLVGGLFCTLPPLPPFLNRDKTVEELHCILSNYLKFSSLLSFSKTQSILSSVNVFLLELYHKKTDCVWEDQIKYILLIEFINKLHNLAESFKFKCYLLLFTCFFGLMTLALSIKCILTFEQIPSK